MYCLHLLTWLSFERLCPWTCLAIKQKRLFDSCSGNYVGASPMGPLWGFPMVMAFCFLSEIVSTYLFPERRPLRRNLSKWRQDERIRAREPWKLERCLKGGEWLTLNDRKKREKSYHLFSPTGRKFWMKKAGRQKEPGVWRDWEAQGSGCLSLPWRGQCCVASHSNCTFKGRKQNGFCALPQIPCSPLL